MNVAMIGGVAVMTFFVISGYLIIQSVLRHSALDYLKHRVLRIYPAYLFWFFAFSILFGNLLFPTFDI